MAPREGADALLAACDLQELLVGTMIPVPGNARLSEGRVEGAAMDTLGLGEGAVDVEDQHGGCAMRSCTLQAHAGAKGGKGGK